MKEITRINHVGLRVSNLNITRKFYERLSSLVSHQNSFRLIVPIRWNMNQQSNPVTGFIKEREFDQMLQKWKRSRSAKLDISKTVIQ